MQQEVSIKEVAEKCGVSIATVSRVLNNKPGFSAKTKELVLKTVDELGYVTNMAAKALRENTSHTIGIIVPTINNTFFSLLAYEIENYFYEKGYSVLICNSGNNDEKEKNYFRTLAAKSVDGIITISGLSELTDDILVNDIPVVCLDRKPDTSRNIPMVYNDNTNAAYIATKHLIDQGCRNIVYISSYTANYRKKEREIGYKKALKDANLPVEENLIILRNGIGNSIEESYTLFNKFIKEGHKFDGILTTSERSAIGVINALNQNNIKVGEDVKLVTFDNTVLSMMSSPPLTSIERNAATLVLKACDTLFNMINHLPYELDNPVETSLIVRKSTFKEA